MSEAATGSPPRAAWTHLAGVALTTIAVQLATSHRYGFYWDELYFLASARQLDWGYVDHPPLTPLLVQLSVALFGDGSPSGLRVVPALLAGLSVLLVGLIARELGAGRAGQTLAAGFAVLTPYLLIGSHLMTTLAVDVAVQLTVCWLFIRMLRTGDRRLWLPIGLAVGIGLQNKYLLLLLVPALVVGLLIAGPRRLLTGPWLVVGAVVAVVIWAPNLIWQARHDWPQLTMAQHIAAEDGAQNRAGLLLLQVGMANPVLFPMVVAGLARLFGRAGGLRRFQPVGWAYLVTLLVLLITGGKGYYAGPLLLVAVAAGGVATAAWWARGGRRRTAGLVAAVAVAAAFALPVSLPLWPADRLAETPIMALNYSAGQTAGWPEFVTEVAAAYRALPAGHRAGTVILTETYGQAGALELYAEALDLPPVYSGHNNYAYWGPPPDDRRRALLVGFDRAYHDRYCRRLSQVGRVSHELTRLNYEYGTPIWYCEGLRRPWSVLWPSLRHYY